MKTIPLEVDEACHNREWYTGETRRVRHLVREDGSDCSSNKSAALSILRKADGWWYRCFRCGVCGFKEDGIVTAPQAVDALAKLQNTRQYKSVTRISLPYDYVRAIDTPRINKQVPMLCYSWLYNNNIDGKLFQANNIGWSDKYQRCIIPIYEHSHFDGIGSTKSLVGWIGRDCTKRSKEDRAKRQISKYILRKTDNFERVFFNLPAESDVYVIVEDVLSAIKVNAACNVNTYALLTTFIPTTMLLALRGKKIVVWLDNDQLSNMLTTVAKGSALGVDISFIHTSRDPKSYNTFAIQQRLGKEVKGG